MSAILPQDLLNISSTEVRHNTDADHAETLFERAQVLHMFWKVHAVRYRVSRHISDQRSRNLFWRTWSNPKLSTTISTNALTELWDTCRGDLDLSSFDLVLKSRWPQFDVVRSDATSHSAPIPQESPDHRKSQWEAPGLLNNDTALSPMVVKTGGSLHTTAQISPSQVRSDADGRQEAVSAGRPKPSRSSSSRNVANRPNAGGRERGSTRGRARPSLARRRSTQSGKPQKSPILDPSGSLEEENESEKLPSGNARSAFALPSASSWEDEASAESGRVSPAALSAEVTELTVDKDFRGRFAERIASTSNLMGMNRMKKTGSVVRFADELPAELRKSKEPLSTTFEDEPRPPLLHRQSVTSVAVSDEDAEEDESLVLSLQRTTSSLSMLLRSVQHEDSLPPLDTEPVNKQKGKDKEKGANEEEALLAMGRRGGVTKAGGVQLPVQQQLRDDIDSGFSSPSPDRIF